MYIIPTSFHSRKLYSIGPCELRPSVNYDSSKQRSIKPRFISMNFQRYQSSEFHLHLCLSACMISSIVLKIFIIEGLKSEPYIYGTNEAPQFIKNRYSLFHFLLASAERHSFVMSSILILVYVHMYVFIPMLPLRGASGIHVNSTQVK